MRIAPLATLRGDAHLMLALQVSPWSNVFALFRLPATTGTVDPSKEIEDAESARWCTILAVLKPVRGLQYV